MRKLTIAGLMIFSLCACRSLTEDTVEDKYNDALVLLADNGFNDIKTHSSINLYKISQLTHASPGFGIFGFYDKIRYTPKGDKFDGAQLQITLNKLEPQNIIVNIHFALLKLDGGKDAFFLSTISNDAGTIDTVTTKIDSTVKSVTLKTSTPSPSGTYYINTMGVNSKTPSSFAVDIVTVDYVNPVKK